MSGANFCISQIVVSYSILAKSSKILLKRGVCGFLDVRNSIFVSIFSKSVRKFSSVQEAHKLFRKEDPLLIISFSVKWGSLFERKRILKRERIFENFSPKKSLFFRDAKWVRKRLMFLRKRSGDL